MNAVRITLAGNVGGSGLSDTTQGTVLATFSVAANAPTGPQNIVIVSSREPTYTLTNGMTIN